MLLRFGSNKSLRAIQCTYPFIRILAFHQIVFVRNFYNNICLFFFSQGATIKSDEENGKIVIARVMHGGAADRSGLIHVGDEVIEVNNINVEGKTPNDVLTILVSIFYCAPRETLNRNTFFFLLAVL